MCVGADSMAAAASASEMKAALQQEHSLFMRLFDEQKQASWWRVCCGCLLSELQYEQGVNLDDDADSTALIEPTLI